MVVLEASETRAGNIPCFPGNQYMLLTMIVAVFNNKTGLEKTIHSFIRQTHSEKELIVIDGGSQDGTIEIIRKYQDHIKYWVSEPDRGIYHAWNKGIDKATGRWACFLGSDDFLWSDCVFEQVAQIIGAGSGEHIYYGKIVSITGAGARKVYLGEAWKPGNMEKHRMPPHAGIFHNVNLIKQLGYFDESFEISSDYEFMLRELKARSPLFMSDIIVAGVQDGGVSAKTRKFTRIVQEDMKARKKNSMPRMSIPFALYYIHMLAHFLKRDLKDLFS